MAWGHSGDESGFNAKYMWNLNTEEEEEFFYGDRQEGGNMAIYRESL